MTRHLDPDEIGDVLADVGDKLFADLRTVGLALKLDDLRRDIGRVLAVQPPAPRRVDPGRIELARRAALAVPPCETSRQAREQGAGDGLGFGDFDAAITMHDDRFVEVPAR